MSLFLVKLLFIGSFAEAKPINQEEATKQQCSNQDAQVIVFDWVDEEVDHQNQRLQENTSLILPNQSLCFLSVSELFKGVRSSSEEVSTLKEISSKMDRLFQKNIASDSEEWIETVKELKAFSEDKKGVSFATHPQQQEKLFETYVKVGVIGGENFDENLKTLYTTSLIEINEKGKKELNNNTNYFLYQAALITINNPDINLIEKLSVEDREPVNWYVKWIQKVQKKQKQELTEEFVDLDTWVFKKRVDIGKDHRSYLDNYVGHLPKEIAKNNIYIVIPKHGDANLVSVWKIGENPNSLRLVEEEEKTELNFMITVGTGIVSSGSSVETAGTNDDGSMLPEEYFRVYGVEGSPEKLNGLAAPIDLNLRGHYKHLMFQAGIAFNKKLGGRWIEYVQVAGSDNEDVVTVTVASSCFNRKDSAEGIRDGYVTKENCDVSGEYFQENAFSQNRYIGLGYVFGNDEQAGKGYGARIGGRVGFLDMPSSLTGSLQAGYTLPIGSPMMNEMQLLVDVDAQAGTMFAGSRNLMFDLGFMENGVAPIYGVTISTGASF